VAVEASEWVVRGRGHGYFWYEAEGWEKEVYLTRCWKTSTLRDETSPNPQAQIASTARAQAFITQTEPGVS
jgi:hypothetical protein